MRSADALNGIIIIIIIIIIYEMIVLLYLFFIRHIHEMYVPFIITIEFFCSSL